MERSADADQLQTVRDCYRTTVMAVPEYEQEYGEGLQENMAAEFGDDLATAVADGDQFSQQLKQLLVRQARVAARRREDLLEAIDSEYTSVTDASTQIREIDANLDRIRGRELLQQSFSELIDLEHDLHRAEDRCDHLLEDRQRDIHQQSRQFLRSDHPFLQEYLYEQLDVTFPVLTATLERLRQLHEQRHAVTRALSRRY